MVGVTRLGDRGIYTITGGHFERPDLRGKVLNGTDWEIAPPFYLSGANLLLDTFRRYIFVSSPTLV